MGAFDEVKDDFLKMALTIGIILGCVALFRVWLISIWLVLVLVALAGIGFWMWKSR